jgi:hypothetical protein
VPTGLRAHPSPGPPPLRHRRAHVHLSSKFTSHHLLMARLCVSRVPVEPIHVMFFAIVASRVYKQLAAIAPNESGVCGYSDLVHFLGAPASLVVMGDAMPEAYASDHPQKLFVFPFGCRWCFG